MKCISKNTKVKKRICILTAILLMFGTTACGNTPFEMPYGTGDNVSVFNVVEKSNSRIVSSFAEDLCIINDNLTDEEIDMSTATAAILCDVNDLEVLYSKNPHERLYPASLTKVMTALVAIKYGSMDQTLTATDVVNITESGAQLCGLKPGDTMTLSFAD